MSRSARVAGGSIRFEGKEIAGAPPSVMQEILWRRMAFVPQSAMNALDPVYRGGKPIEEVLVHRGNYRREDVPKRIAELLEMVGRNPKRQNDYPHQFSGGMRQRVGIALALALNPALMIADEPVTALDVIVQRQVLDTLKDLQRRLNLSVIIVTHDISVVAYVCDRVVVMYAGEVVESGKVKDVLEQPVHPYTMGLTNAFPDLGRAAGTLVPIAGSPPDLRDPPPGCRIAPRCPFAEPRCAQTSPPLVTDEKGHAAACLRANEAPMLREQARDPARWAA